MAILYDFPMKFLLTLQESLKIHSKRNAFFIDGTYFTYGQLDIKISQIRYAIQNEIPPSEKLIGLVTNDDLETYAGIIALWFEGKAYVPINPIYPIDRNNQILKLTDSSYVLDSSSDSAYKTKFKVLNTNTSGPVVSQSLKPNLNLGEPIDLAYILFTSGSTGTPKGVPITLENLNGLVRALDRDELFNLKPSDRCLQMFELTFDFSLVTYLPPLLYGACVYTIPKNAIKHFYIFKLISEQELTVLTMVPSIIQFLRPYFGEIHSTSVRYCSFGGGKLYNDIAESWSACIPNCQIFNYYGPTEFTVYSGYYPYDADKKKKSNNGIVSIGKPFYGVDYLVVDTNNNEVSVDTVGELCLSGIQITSGYWKDPERNKSAFFTRQENGALKRYYKTGDLCYKDTDGDYIYVGRADFQVKIRGYRVELGEVEYHVKKKLSGIDVVVIDITDDLGNTELGLAVCSEELDLKPVLSYLKEMLPPYMIPTQFLYVQ